MTGSRLGFFKGVINIRQVMRIAVIKSSAALNLSFTFAMYNNPITKGNDMTITGRFNCTVMTDKQLEEYLLRIRGLYVKVS